jgi:putative tryptophan/tyrosine transport system substrate-binding protein
VAEAQGAGLNTRGEIARGRGSAWVAADLLIVGSVSDARAPGPLAVDSGRDPADRAGRLLLGPPPVRRAGRRRRRAGGLVRLRVQCFGSPAVLATATYLTSTVESPHHPGMDRRRFLLTSVAGALAAPRAAAVQESEKVHRLGFLAYQPCRIVLDRNGPFIQGLHQLGYFEGRNLVIECRDAIGRFDRLPDLAVELVRLNPDILVTEGTPQSVAGKRATTKIPIIMVGVGDPVGNELVASLARPGGNVTGSSMFPAVDVVVKGLELLKQVVPRVSRVAVLWDPTNLALVSVDKQLDEATRPLQIRLQRVSVRAVGDVERAFGAVLDHRAQALLVHPLPVGPAGLERVFEFGLTNGLPAVTWSELYAAMPGVLLSYGPHFPEVYRRAAALVDKILKGANPAETPVEQPSRFTLVINAKTAKALGLTIPPSLLLRADQVIE